MLELIKGLFKKPAATVAVAAVSIAAVAQVGFFDASALFGRQNTAKLPDGMVIHLCRDNNQKQYPNPKPDALVYHWSAGTYNQVFDGYHFCVVYNPANGNVWIVQTLKLSQKGYHLWGRNGGTVSISFMGMRGASPRHQGQYPIVQVMAEAGWAFGAELAMYLGLNVDPDHKIAQPHMASNATKIWATGKTIYMPQITDHRDWARVDGYEEHRWDIGDFFSNWKGKVQWYYAKLLSGERRKLASKLS